MQRTHLHVSLLLCQLAATAANASGAGGDRVRLWWCSVGWVEVMVAQYQDHAIVNWFRLLQQQAVVQMSALQGALLALSLSATSALLARY